ncbi:MAG: hypothetical protein WCO56_19105 [Verrucomicrobiota bacterium]
MNSPFDNWRTLGWLWLWLSILTCLGSPVPVNIQIATNDSVDSEYRTLLRADDEAQAEVDEWIKASQSNHVESVTVAKALLQLRISRRFEPVGEAYQGFLKVHPEHTRARLAYASFLRDWGHEPEALEQLEKARTLAPANAVVWNNLGNFYGHNGPATNAFTCYARALELNPREPLYYQNYARNLLLFRGDAMNVYHLSLRDVITKAQDLYRKALELCPTNFTVASDLAQSYYAVILPVTTNATVANQAVVQLGEESLAAWRRAEAVAEDDVQRQGVWLHYARICISLQRFDDAQKHLDKVQAMEYLGTCNELTEKLKDARAKAGK